MSVKVKIVPKVKHLIEYLQNNFDPESPIMLERDGWQQNEHNVDDELDLIKKRGLFQEWRGNLVVNN